VQRPIAESVRIINNLTSWIPRGKPSALSLEPSASDRPSWRFSTALPLKNVTSESGIARFAEPLQMGFPLAARMFWKLATICSPIRLARSGLSDAAPTKRVVVRGIPAS